MKKKTRYEGKRIVTYTFSKEELVDLLETAGCLRGLPKQPKLLISNDGAIHLEYTYDLKKE